MLFLPDIAKFLVKIFGLLLLPWSWGIAIKEGRFGAYRREVGRGWDILGGKLYEPVFNKKLMKEGGRKFGQDETISECMAVNKLLHHDTKTADVVERGINIFDKDHLAKTLKKINTTKLNLN